MEYNYESLKQYAKDRSCSPEELVALAPHNDPFYTGKPGEVEGARWFADLYHQFYTGESGIHLRRIHYRIVSQDPPVLMPPMRDPKTGETARRPYENTDKCWNYLNQVSKWARYLKLVDVDAFVDKRNQEPIINAWFYGNNEEDPGQVVTADWRDELGKLELPELPGLPELASLPELPKLLATGYDVQQPYLIEIWVEKTTMNDVLEPICREYNVNLITGAGELSITAVREFLRRARRAGRPARILYVSDFDPAGLGMPISISRKIEFYQRNDWRFEDLDIALQPVVLTEAQVAEYRLPRVPVKDSDKRKERFEAGHGEGQVELDALEALYPGTLANIVRNEVLRYYDTELAANAVTAKKELQDELDSLGSQARLNHQDELDTVDQDYSGVLGEYAQLQNEWAELIAPFAGRLETLRERLAALREQTRETYNLIESELEEAGNEVDLDEYKTPESKLAGDPDSVLYESNRPYFEQLAAYKAQRDGAD